MLDRSKNPKRSRDFFLLARHVATLATGEIQEHDPYTGKNPHTVELGKISGVKGGPARNLSITKKRRSEIEKKAAKARWKKK